MSETVTDRLRLAGVAALTDAMGRVLDHEANVLDLVSPTPGRVLFGVAATVRFLPYRADRFSEDATNFARCFYAAIEDEPSGKVVVIDSAGYTNTSVGGGTKFSRLHNNGVAGLITDARLRDFQELATYDPVFYCAGEAVRAGTAAIMPIAVNVPVVLGGAAVFPGDFIYADGSGAVVIPATHFEAVLDAAIAIAHTDEAQRRTIVKENKDTGTGRGEL